MVAPLNPSSAGMTFPPSHGRKKKLFFGIFQTSKRCENPGRFVFSEAQFPRNNNLNDADVICLEKSSSKRTNLDNKSTEYLTDWREGDQKSQT